MPTYNARVAGIYRATYQGCTEKEMINPETQEAEPRYIWRFQEKADPTTAGVIDKITGTSMQSPNSNAHKIAAGIVGRKLQPGDDTEAYIGQEYDVVYGPNQAGNLTITSVVKASGAKGGTAEGTTYVVDGPKGLSTVTVPDGTDPPATVAGGDLPF